MSTPGALNGADAAPQVDAYCNNCGLRVTEPAPADLQPTNCPRCHSARRMIAPHRPGYSTLADASDADFDAFGRLSAGVRKVGDRDIALGFELPLGYDAVRVREGLRTTAPVAAIHVPHSKVGEARGPGGDLLVWYQTTLDMGTAIVTWWEIGRIAQKVVEYLRSESPNALVTDGVAISLGAALIYEELGRVSMDYAFVLPSSETKSLAITIPPRAFLVGFESDDELAWAVVADNGSAISSEHCPAASAPTWWAEAKAIDRGLSPVSSPREGEW